MSKFWIEDLPEGYYDKVLVDGLSKGRGIQPSWHNKTFLEVSQFLYQSFNHLDYACGPGSFIGNFSSCKSVGVDISKNQINYAKKKYSEHLFLTLDEFRSLDKEEKKYDLITILGLFEFIKDEEIINLLDDFYNMLNKNGKIVITTLNYKSNMKHFLKLINIFGSVGYENQHISKFNYEKLLQLFSKTKFKNYNVRKFITFGIFLSSISINFGLKMDKFYKKFITRNNGYLLLGILEK